MSTHNSNISDILELWEIARIDVFILDMATGENHFYFIIYIYISIIHMHVITKFYSFTNNVFLVQIVRLIVLCYQNKKFMKFHLEIAKSIYNVLM